MGTRLQRFAGLSTPNPMTTEQLLTVNGERVAIVGEIALREHFAAQWDCHLSNVYAKRIGKARETGETVYSVFQLGGDSGRDIAREVTVLTPRAVDLQMTEACGNRNPLDSRYTIDGKRVTRAEHDAMKRSASVRGEETSWRSGGMITFQQWVYVQSLPASPACAV